MQFEIGFSQKKSLLDERSEIFSINDSEGMDLDKIFANWLKADLVSNDDVPEKSTVNENGVEVVVTVRPWLSMASMLKYGLEVPSFTALPVLAMI